MSEQWEPYDVSEDLNGAPPQAPCALTDLGNAERLVRRSGADVRYVSLWGKWLLWTGTRWKEDETEDVLLRAVHVARSIFNEAGSELDEASRKALARHAIATEKKERLLAMVRLAQALPPVPLTPDVLDCDPWMLNTPTGTVDLRTGELHEHRQGDLITKITGAPIDPQATCPRFERFVEEIMAGNKGLAAFLKRMLGYAATGDTRERRLFVLHGNGRNGKSTLLTIVAEALGDYAMKTPASTLLAKRDGGIPNDVARLKGARLVYASESGEGRRLDEALIKELTSREPMTARFMRAEWFEFTPEFKPLLGTNHRPEIQGTDDGIWDRVCLIPFGVRFKDDKDNKGLIHELRAELPGILRWLVEGALEWQKDGLNEPAEVLAATVEYREESDRLEDFITECCIRSLNCKAASGKLFERYTEWCRGNGQNQLTQTAFGSRLKQKGFRQTRGGGGIRLWEGLGLLNQEPRREPGQEG